MVHFWIAAGYSASYFGYLVSIRPTVHSHDTRGSVDSNVPGDISSGLFIFFFFSYRLTRKWSSSTRCIKIIRDPNIFRKILKELLFAEYEF